MQKIKNYIIIGIICFLFGSISTAITGYFIVKNRLDEAQSIIRKTNDQLKQSQNTNQELAGQLETLRKSIKSSTQFVGQLDNTINESQRINDEARKLVKKYISN